MGQQIRKTDKFLVILQEYDVNFFVVLLYLPSWDEWIEIKGHPKSIQQAAVRYLPSWDEWIEIKYIVSPFAGCVD